MARVASGLDHGYPHSGAAQPIRGQLGECGSQTLALMIGIDGLHRDLPHALSAVEGRGDETDDAWLSLADPTEMP